MDSGATGGKAAKVITIRDFKSEGRAIDQVNWPGTGRKVGVLYLHCADYQQAYFAARERFEDMRVPVDPVGDPFFDREYSWQLCNLMLIQPGIRQVKSLFKDIEQARRELEPNEVDFFIDYQQSWQQRRAADWGLDEKGPTAQQ